MVIAFTTVAGLISLWGCLQYIGVLQSNGVFIVTGAFDNPAGFASAVVILFPFILLAMLSQEPWTRYLAYFAFILSFIAIPLSCSRAGMLCVLMTLLLGGYKFITKKSAVKWLFIIMWIIVFLVVMWEKIDSASGRLLIWSVSWDMICDNWLWGHGSGAFNSEYMNYQAAFLAESTNEKWKMLADNIQHPFNEFILLWVNYGIFAPFLVFLFFCYLVFQYIKDQKPEKLAAILSISATMIFALVSYPFKYPITWFVFIYSVTVLIRESKWFIKISNGIIKVKRYLIIFVILALGFYVNEMIGVVVNEYKWASVVQTGVYGKKQMAIYSDLYPKMKRNRFFLYNYSYALFHTGRYDEAMNTINECSYLWMDYDVIMLKGLIANKLCEETLAIECFDVAHMMCPNRFSPLYMKLKLYEKIDDNKAALNCAQEIIDKRIKIPSAEVVRILNYAKKVIDKSN